MEKLRLDLVKLLFVRLTSIYGKKFTENYPNDKIRNVWFEDWSEGLAGLEPKHIKQAVHECRMNLAWPPSLAEFRKLCEQASGVPSESQVLDMLVRKDISHPVVQICLEKIGTWRISNMQEKDLMFKVKEIYKESLNVYRNDIEGHWKALEQTQNIPSTLVAPTSKQLSHEDRMSFKQQYQQWLDKSSTEKQSETIKLEFDVVKCNRSSNFFDQDMYNKRKAYLINLSEEDACKLETYDRYDRIRMLREQEANALVSRNTPRSQPENRNYEGVKSTYNYM